MTTKLVNDVQGVTRMADMSDAFLISAALTIVCTNGTNGSSHTGPGGMSAGSTEYGKEGGLVMEESTSFTWGRVRFDVLVDTAFAEPRLPLREDICSRVVKEEEEEERSCGFGGTVNEDDSAIVLCVTVVVFGGSVEWNARVVVVVVAASMRQPHHVVSTRQRRGRCRSLCDRSINIKLI